jgi:hypothetical protein
MNNNFSFGVGLQGGFPSGGGSGDDGYLAPPPSRSSASSSDRHPWKVSLTPDPIFPLTGDPSAVIRSKGNLTDTLLSTTLLDIPSWVDGESYEVIITETGVVCLLYTYAVGETPPVITVEFQTDAQYEPYDDNGADPPEITATRYPLALIVTNPDPPEEGTKADQYLVKQLARSNMAKTIICYNGKGLTTFTPI